MEQLKKTYCRFDMVCDNPTGAGLELVHMPSFFAEKSYKETDIDHVHGFYEIVWFQEGAGVHNVDFNEYPVVPNSVFFISPGQVHSFDQRHDQKGIVLKFCDELLNEAHNNDSIYLKYNIFNAFDNIPYLIINEEAAAKLSAIVKDIDKEIEESGKIGHKDYLQALVKMFLICVQRGSANIENAPLNPSRNSNKVFLEFRQLLEENFTTLHTVKDYASLLNVSTKTLTMYVNDCSPYSPLEIINNRIILEAKRLLRYSNLMIKEIAYRLGFEDPSYFVKFFKRQVHHSPADYREPIE